MTDSNDAPFEIDREIDQELRARTSASASNVSLVRDRPNKPRERNTAPYRHGEEAPLLGSGSSRPGSGNSQRRSEGEPFTIAELEGIPWWKRPSVYWLIPPFLVFATAFGGIIVPKLNLILDLICDEYYAEQSVNDPTGGLLAPEDGYDRCRIDAISARVSMFTLYGNLASGLLAAIISPKLGALSDRIGRKKILVITAAGTLVGEIITILTAKFPETVDVNWILLGYAVDGLCGSFILSMAITHAYATDCTSPQKRNVAFAYFHSCLFTGIAVGPIVAGYVIKKTGSVLLVFYVALGCHLLFIMFILFCVPESLSKSRMAAAQEKYRIELERLGPAADWINQLRQVNLFRPLKILYPTGPGTSPALRRNLILLAATDTICFSVAMGVLGVVVIYTRLEFGWQDWESSKFVSIVNVCRVVCLLGILPLVTRLVRGKNGAARQRSTGSDNFDLFLIRIAILFDMVGFLGYTLARDGNLFILSGAVASAGGMGSPTLGSALTKHVPPERVGQLLGATGLLHALARVLGPTIFNGIYSATVSKFRQTVFVCLTATFGLAFVTSWLVRPHIYLDEQDEDVHSPPSENSSSEDGFAR